MTGSDHPRGKVLVGDDHPLIGQLIARSLSEQGYEVTVETDGEQLAAVARREQPDVAVIDANMAPSEQFAALRAVRALPEATRPAIIVITGDSEPSVRRAADELGAQGFLLKPWEPDELFETVARLLGERRGAVTPEPEPEPGPEPEPSPGPGGP